LADARLELDPERILVAADGSRLVGISAELPFRMTLPGGADVPVTGLTWVSVDLMSRRRGVLRSLMEHQLGAAAAGGQAAVILAASEGGIYGRYGFGVATQVRRSVVSRRRARLAAPAVASPIERLPTERAAAVLPDIYERWRRVTPGGVTRDERRWKLLLLDREDNRQGRSGLFHLVHQDGYVSYRIKENWGDGDPQHECFLVDYVPVTAEAHAALWGALLSLDLVGTIESYGLPLDDPLPFLLEDVRGVETKHLGDGLWVRPVDVEQLLGKRCYGVDVDCVLGVRDTVLGDARYALRGGPDGATCTRTDRAPDVDLSVADLGAVSLGGVRLGRLARAGRFPDADPALVARLDLALLADREPRHGTAF
jgi:predicted acetyltransferase